MNSMGQSTRCGVKVLDVGTKNKMWGQGTICMVKVQGEVQGTRYMVKVQDIWSRYKIYGQDVRCRVKM